jgi:chromate transporter
MYLLHTPFALVVGAAAIIGLAIRGPDSGAAPAEPIGRARAGATANWRHLLLVTGAGVAAWWLPVLLLALALGPSHVTVACGLFFGKVAVLSFGGAYAVLSFVAQEAVQRFAWLTPAEMLDGLGLAETTPGPLVLVLQFVAFLAGYRDPGPFSPYVGGLAASLVTLWVTFVPSFLWIFLGAPYVERLRENAVLRAALAGVSAAVVGVILNLAAWFALHVLFAEVSSRRWGLVHLQQPVIATIDPVATVIALGALVALMRLRWGMVPTLLAGAGVGAAWHLFRP